MTDAHANFTIYGMSIYRGFVTGFMVPFWFLAFVSATTAVLPWLPWIKWRFTLRTMLIATTLVAVVLGLIVAVL
jgi:asparagine N-glycosylation enzyme membrane subunit Stt3